MTTERVLPPYRASRREEASASESASAAGPRSPIAAPRLTAAAPRPAMASLAKRRGDAYFSTATRAGVLIGVSAAVYAVSLATVAGLQAQAQADAAAAVQPAVDTLASAQAANDQIEAAIKEADSRIQALAHDYNAAGTDMTAVQAQFSELSALVAKIQGTAAAINTNFKLPTVSIRGAIGGGGGTVVTTTTASGKP
jgi:hypothetical protein